MSTPRKVIETDTSYGRGSVNNFASILDHNTLEQALMTARHPVVKALALMPDAHLGRGATVGSVLLTEGGLLPAAVGVDIGCGVEARRLDLTLSRFDTQVRHIINGMMNQQIASGVGSYSQGFAGKALAWRTFLEKNPFTPTFTQSLKDTAANQFGSLGSGNHFAEFSVDEDEGVWLVLHSGSRGVGNQIASAHIKEALRLNREGRYPLEHEDLAVLFDGTQSFRSYTQDLLWLQEYARWQRSIMLDQMHEIVSVVLHENVGVSDVISCHHNYTELVGRGYLTRKGAINAQPGHLGIIPGSMGADTLIVTGDADFENALWSAPHGAGRLLARGAAKRTLDIDEFRATMEARGVTWQDRSAQALLDEAPLAYKPMAVIEKDAVEGGLIRADNIIRLRPFINYKGV